ncbi:MAG: glycosyltransferase family 2 protein [bacterium]|nr:glycosyltransferase family 2 protein [bacterium]
MVKIILALVIGLYIPLIDSVDFIIKLIYRKKNTKEGNSMLPTSVKKENARNKNGANASGLNSYKVIISVYNISKTFENFVKNIKPFGYQNILIIDDASSDNTAALLKERGIPFITNEHNLQKPASILNGLKKLPERIYTVIVMDPDSAILNLNPKEHNKKISDFDEVLNNFQNSSFDACAVRILVEGNSILERLQNFEYKISMGLAKKSMEELTVISGAFAFFKRGFLESVLSKHSQSVYGEDYETSLRILTSGGHIYYDGRLSVLTKQRKTLKDLTQQRMGWDFSLIKIDTLMAGQLRFLPRKFYSIYQYIIYNIFISVIFHPLRMLSIVLLAVSFLNFFDNLAGLNLIPDYYFTNPALFLYFYVFCMLIMYLLLISVERRRRNKYYYILPLFPFYSLYMGLVPKTLGFLNFITIKIFGVKVVEDGYKYA